jgi:aminoglycoside 3'-phosphotransferase-1
MDAQRERRCAAITVPAEISARLEGYAWARDMVGESGSAVYRLHGRSGAPDLYLKHGRGCVADDVVDEMVRLRWLAAHVPVPAVPCFVSTPGEAWLLTTALPGETAYQALCARPADAIAIVDALADFLRRLHAIPVSACPFDAGHLHRLALAHKRIEAQAAVPSDAGRAVLTRTAAAAPPRSLPDRANLAASAIPR